VSSFSGEAFCDGGANAAATADHDGDLVGQSAHVNSI
jgi:hypothetical protein